MMRNRVVVAVLVCLSVSVFLGSTAALACTDVVVGKNASRDGSTITSHTCDEGGYGGGGSGIGYDARIRVVPGQTFPEGSTFTVYRQTCEAGPSAPLIVVGEIPQVEKTYTYFHVAYPFLNEHGLAIGETTIAQREELVPSDRAILTIEQLEILALQRCKTAREAIVVIGELAERYGFQSSCASMGECITLADGNEAWVMEIYGVGPFWTPDSGEPGAIWVARRVGDDQVCVVPNVSRIGVIEEGNLDFMYSKSYKDVAIENGWYDPASGEPFNITTAYTPETGSWSADSMWIRNRLWYIYSLLCPSQTWDHDAPLSAYPFSVKPEKKVSVQDVIAFQRSSFEGTEHSLADLPAWFVPDGKGGKTKSPLATPFITDDMANLLCFENERPVSRYNCSYGFVAEVRSWLPEPVKACLWYYNDNPATSMYVPVYNGVTELPVSWRTNDRFQYSRNSAWWAFATVDQYAGFRFQDAIKDIAAARDPVEAGFFAMQPCIERVAAEIWARDPAAARSFITGYTSMCMKKAESTYWELADLLMCKYVNNQY
ncbi:MAG: C69 family dipeptidase [Firmicutes bacterium]|jgi:dipeptidase|nr:C69 family dipeptidase [Bacillota bacterium]